MKKLKLFISLWFTMFSMVVFGQAEYEKIAITQNTQDNTAGRLLVQDVTTGEVRWILKSILDNKFNQPTGNATQYLDGAGTPTTFPVLGQSDRVITEVRNSTGATITKGTVVYLNGATGGKPNVLKAQANAEATSSGTFGVIQSDINNNSNGYVVVIGTVLGLNTSAYTAGQVLWLSPTTAGGFTTTKPVAPNHAVYVGIVTLAATQGTIEVKIQNGYELDEIHDVLITSKTDNDGLIYESASGLWKNKQITKAMVGLANVDNTSDLNKPISTATQTALNLKENTANKNTANGYAGLGSDGKLISSQLPAITITDTFVVGSQAAMLALTAETGDVAVRTDVNKSFILKGTSAGTLADWQELLTPTSTVSSVFGRTGAVTANSGDYTADQISETASRKFQSLEQKTYNDATSSIQTQLNSKANDNAVVHLAGSESVTGAKIFTATPSFDSNIYLKKLGSWANPANYSVIGGMPNGFVLSSENNKHAYLDLLALTQAQAFSFPNKSGTFAMTSDVPTISGTTNYVTKFTGTSTLGNSLIFDNGSGIGIGSASPSEILHLRSSQPVIRFEKTGILNWKIGNISGNNFTINTDSGGGDAFNITTSGNVGIGTTSPAEKLHVYGKARFFDAGYPYIDLGINTSNYWRIINDNPNDNFIIGKNGASNFVMQGSSGNVAINGTPGSYKFFVNGGQYGTILKGGDLGVGSEILKLIKADDAVAMIARGDGNIGIGSVNPGAKLTVVGASPNTYLAIDNVASGINYYAANNYHEFQTAGVQRMTITSAGDVIAGKDAIFGNQRTANDSGATGVSIFGSSSSSTSAQLNLTQVWNGIQYPVILRNTFNPVAGSASSVFTLSTSQFNGSTSAATERLRIDGNSGASTFTGSVTASSFIKSGGTSSQYLMADGSVKTSPGSYKVYTALLNQTGTNAPTATVLENTLGGTIVWSYVSIGQYRGTLTGAFLSNKTVVFLTNVYGKYFLTGGRENDNSVMIGTQAPNGGSTNGDLSNSSIEIRVYN